MRMGWGLIRLGWALAAGVAPGLASAPEGEDVVVLRNGSELRGTVKDLRGRFLKMNVRVGESDRAGKIERAVPLADVERVWFHERLAAMGPGDSDSLEGFWESRRRYLAAPGSEAGEAGLLLARRLLDAKGVRTARRAEAIAREVSRQDPDAKRQQAAQCAMVEALVQQDLLDDAEKALTTAVDSSPALNASGQLRRARSTLAWARVLELEAEFPRWRDDPEVNERHMDWVDVALEGAIHPFLFDPDNIPAAAAGLEDAVCRLAHLGRKEEAAVYAEDLARLYPDSPQAERTVEWRGEPPREDTNDGEGVREERENENESNRKGTQS
ncbi:MAG TPA: hypothetical protein VMN36_06575 [Verrucomicrobiales bacterium]|nr:hypothetical protein [Verrucomicrobiales bacterium]